jgi:outer membrane lipoprotein SlyB
MGDLTTKIVGAELGERPVYYGLLKAFCGAGELPGVALCGKGREMRRLGSILIAVTVLGGCAQSYQPIVDTKGQDTARYQQDLYECRQYAQQVSPTGDAAIGGLGAAAGGAALGAIAGAILPGFGAGTGAAVGAATGGVVGVAGGATKGVTDQQRIINNCLRGRGYSVLN